LDNNGTYETNGATVTATFADNGSYPVGVRATDQGGLTATTTTTVTVLNVAPTITAVSNNGPKQINQPVTIQVTATDPAGASDPLQYEFDCDNNGSYEVGPQAGNSATCTFSTNGTYTVNVRVTDGDSGVDTDTTTVQIANELRVYLPLIRR
jgi:PKD repeat protein